VQKGGVYFEGEALALVGLGEEEEGKYREGREKVVGQVKYI